MWMGIVDSTGGRSHISRAAWVCLNHKAQTSHCEPYNGLHMISASHSTSAFGNIPREVDNACVGSPGVSGLPHHGEWRVASAGATEGPCSQQPGWHDVYD